MKGLPKILFALTGVAALSLAYPASVQAVPTTYVYTGNPFTTIRGSSYTTSDFVSGMVRLAGPLGANMPLTEVTPTAWTFFDGVTTISNHDQAVEGIFLFATDAAADITEWFVVVGNDFPNIRTEHAPPPAFGTDDAGLDGDPNQGFNSDSPGVWSVHASVPDAGSTLSLMTLTLMALGLVARRFKRAAG